LVLFLFLGSFAALATVMVQLSLDQLTREADTVVLGHCTNKRVFKTGEMIYTEYTIQSYDVLKGSTAAEFKITQPGGALNGKGVYVSGVARFSPMEEVMLFLTKEKNGSRDIVGWSQGKLHVYYDAATGQKLAVQQMGGAGMLNKTTGAITESHPAAVSLEQLRSQVKTIVAKQKDGKK
jgi:hypothetical protein